VSQVLALVSAVLFGFGDFTGGYVTRRVPVWTVTLWSQLIGLTLLVVGLVVVPATSVTSSDLAWGAVGGLIGVFGIVLFYSALAGGSVAIVAPLSAATTAALPVGVDLATGGSLSTAQTVGVALAIVAIALVSFDRRAGSATPHQIGLALAAGVAFAVFFVALSNTEPESGLWPLVAARVASIPVALAAAVVAGKVKPPRGRDLQLTGAAGLADMGANVAIALSLQRGSLAVNSVLSSLYPAVTAGIAVAVLHERPRPWQWVGISAAMVAVVLLAT